MRVGIACHPTVGGSGVVATELARALAEGGDEVHLMSYAVPPRWTWAGPRLYFHEVAVAQYPLFEYPPYDLALATKMVEVARQHRLDLLHVHYAVPNAVVAILARQILAPQPIKVITTLHGTDITLVGNDPSYVETTRFGIVESDQVTAVSEALKRSTHETFQITTPIEVVPELHRSATASTRRSSAVAASASAQPGERILGHISNFRAGQARSPTWCRSSIAWRREIPCRLLLVGDGPELPRAERQARELGMRDRVDLIGTVANIEDVLAHVDLFLLPSETESFGLAALEALSCEVPVIASRVGGAARGHPRRRERLPAAGRRRRRHGRGRALAPARRGPPPRVRRRRPPVGGDPVLARGRGGALPGDLPTACCRRPARERPPLESVWRASAMLPPLRSNQNRQALGALPKEDSMTDQTTPPPPPPYNPPPPPAASGAAERRDDRPRVPVDPRADSAAGREGRSGGAVARQARSRPRRGRDRASASSWAFSRTSWRVSAASSCAPLIPFLVIVVVHVLCIVKGMKGERFIIPGLSPLADRF